MLVSRALFLYLLPLLYSVPQIAASASLNFNLFLLNLTGLLYYACVLLTHMVISKVTSTRKLCLPPFTQEYSPLLLCYAVSENGFLCFVLFFFFSIVSGGLIWHQFSVIIIIKWLTICVPVSQLEQFLVFFHWVCFSTFKISSFYFIPKHFHYWHSGKQLDWLRMMPYEVWSLKKENILSLTRTLVGESKPFCPEFTSDCQNFLDQV